MLQTRHRSRPLSLIYDVIPFALAAVQGCPYHDKLLFCHSSLVTLNPAPHLPLVATCSIAWSVPTSVLYINPNTSPKELQLSSLGYFPSLQDELLVIPTCPVVTRASRKFLPLLPLLPLIRADSPVGSLAGCIRRHLVLVPLVSQEHCRQDYGGTPCTTQLTLNIGCK